ncbi:hypothetical protein ACFOET_16590 [Parapedobacter deserti]|uniref:Beta-carotene 15,15'-monooxygenase n=1 Tax=Parapedobacter deserti TaxID=1912957 RepID=A0ABV7JMC5_9SPHI
MKHEKDYFQEIAAIRSMMERTSKFLSLSGWAGIMAGIYALIGAYLAYGLFHVNADGLIVTPVLEDQSNALLKLAALALATLFLALVTAILLSYKKANKRGEKLWNATAKRLLIDLAVPLVTGGLLILLLISKGFIGLAAPFTLIFYGLALYNAGKFTYGAVRALGLLEVGLGLISVYFTDYGLLFWAFGFGLLHIVYGIYIHYRYER